MTAYGMALRNALRVPKPAESSLGTLLRANDTAARATGALVDDVLNRPFPRDAWQALADATRDATVLFGKRLRVLEPQEATGPAPWLDTLYELAAKADKSGAVGFVIDHFDALAEAEQYEDLDLILKSADLERLPPEVLIALVRVPYLIHMHLEAWQGAVYRIALALHGRGLNAKGLLTGLL